MRRLKNDQPNSNKHDWQLLSLKKSYVLHRIMLLQHMLKMSSLLDVVDVEATRQQHI